MSVYSRAETVVPAASAGWLWFLSEVTLNERAET
jgi:hypothetical protein